MVGRSSSRANNEFDNRAVYNLCQDEGLWHCVSKPELAHHSWVKLNHFVMK